MKKGVSLPFLATAGNLALKRWDVAVFKLPEEPEVRYIKRMVGMPGEVLRIEHGDIWARPSAGPGDFERQRRPLDHQQAMQMMVYDDTHRAAALRDDPRWLRWKPTRPGTWTEQVSGTFVPVAHETKWAELRYHHLVPTPEQWAAIRDGQKLP